MQVTLLSYTLDALAVCATSARTCYSDLPPEEIKISRTEAIKLLDRVIKSGHHSVLEHASFTFSIAGVSRALTHQLVRHRIASFSQQSQRYVKLDQPDYVYPFNDEEDSSIQSIYVNAMELAWKAYNELVDMGVPPEDARYVLPNACTTNIVVTMNARELFHFFSLRLCNKSQWEIRELANEMYDLCMDVVPEIFAYVGPPCWTDKCHETKPCGNPPKRD